MTMKVVSALEDDLLPTSALQMTTNLRFADDIVVNAEEEEEGGILVDHLDTTTRQDKSDDKQPKWRPKRDQDKRSEARRSGELQVPWSNHLERRIKTQDFFPG